MIDLLASDMQMSPYKTLSLMREKYPVCKVEPDNLWALTRYKDVEFALKRHDLFSSAAIKYILAPDWLSPDCKRELFLLTEDPPIHTRRRTLINKTFVSGVVNALEPLMRETAQALIQQIRNKSSVEFMEDFSYPYAEKIIKHIIGVEDKQGIDSIRKWINTLGKLTIVRPDDTEIPALEAAIRQQICTLTEVIQECRENPRDDFVTQLISTTSEDVTITDDMLADLLDILIRAGYTTTVHILGNTVLQLSKHPSLANLLRTDPSKIPRFIEEILRLYSPNLCTIRQATQPIELHNTVIPEHSLVLIYMSAANREPSKFPNPDTIDLSRLNAKEHLSFGSGPHTCIGMALARLEVKVAVETILQNFTDIICPEAHDLDWIYSIVRRGLNSLPVRLS